MRYFLTGATGFIGGRLAQQLRRAGHDVVAIARDPARATDLVNLGVDVRRGDVMNRGSLHDGMRDADGVFHVAGWYALGRLDRERMQAINVEGTRNTLQVAAERAVPRIVHTSTVGVFGNTHGRSVDESHFAAKDTMTSEYERTKWEAHYGVAVPLQRSGAPVMIAMPGGVTGAGDTSPHTQVFDLFLRHTPVMFGARSGLTWAHVDDVAHGLALVMERARVGESYIIAGPALTYRQTFEILERVSGIPATRTWAPGWLAVGLSAIVGAFEAAGMRFPVSAEGLRTLTDYTFWASAEKARSELGWTPRPVEDVLREVLQSMRSCATRS